MNSRKEIDLQKLEHLYTDSLRRHGTTPLGVGWSDEISHTLRFQVLAQIIDPRHEFTVADLGCGYGAFYDFLVASNIPPVKYFGYDISDAMISEAKRRRLPGSEFLKGASVDREVDYSFASGIFNVRFKENENRWRDFVIATLDDINNKSRKGFSFNLLSSYVDWKEDHLYYGDPLFFFDYCKKNFSRHVALVHDYPLWEWTIVIRK